MKKKSKDKDTVAEIRRMDIRRLKSEVEMRKEIFYRIRELYEKDKLLLREAEERLAIYLGEETA